MKCHRRFYTISLVFLVTFVGFLNIGLSPIMAQEEGSKKQLIFETAVNLANLPSDAQLVRFDKNYDYEHNGFVWLLEWKTNNNLISVEVDDASLEILYYIDTSQTSQQKVGDITENSKLIVLNKAKQLLASMESYGIRTLPNNARILCIEIMSGDWSVVWGHEIDSVLIEGDEISVTMNIDCNKILSYRKVWNNIQIDTTPSLSSKEVKQILHSLHTSNVQKITSELIILDVNKTNKDEKNYCLAYEITVTDRYGKTDIFRINANTGTLVEYDTTMYGWDYQDVYVTTDWFPGQRRTAYNVYRRLLSSTFSLGSTRFYEDETAYSEMTYMHVRSLFFHMGHGTYTKVGEEHHSVIVTIDGHIAPSDILPKATAINRLIFLGSCFSFGGTVDGIVLDYSVGEAFLDGGSRCVFGWVGGVTLSQDWKFSEFFFDKAVNGYNFDACYEYAKSQIRYEDRLKARIEGDTYLTLREDDAGADAYPGSYLGSGSDTTFNIYDEGTWGIIERDIDWYRFTVSGTRHVEIFVRPIDSSLDAKFRVYDAYYNLIYIKDSGGYGANEWVSFTGSGTYYLKIYPMGDSAVSHGGAYNLEIRIQIIS